MDKDFFKRRPLSWSALSSFEYSKEQWYDTYILGKKQSSKEMTFGSVIDKRFQEDKAFIPEIDRGEHLQYKMKVVFNGIPLVGIPDILSLDKIKHLADLKTGKKAWDQKRADETGQLTMYLLMLYVMHKVNPEEFDCAIHWLPTRENGSFHIELVEPVKVQTFKTKRTMMDVLRFGERINRVVKEMGEYAAAQKLSPFIPLTPNVR